VLADHKGRTLYYTKQSAPRGVKGDTWLPIEAPWLASPRSPWSTTPLPGGGRQWSYQGHPLYRYARDHDPKEIRGHGLEDGWTAVILAPPPALPPWASVQRVDLGWVFANEQGLTVYAPARPAQMVAAQTCPPECMRRFWRPVLAQPHDEPVGRWTIIVNADGQRQWTYQGRPLYTHTRDQRPGEMQGNSFAVGYAIGDGFRIIPIDSQMAASGS
jgi:predicted lipoprotein with Yx(FWY)xxD motif